ncbi:MAG: triose-phosphate isomerase [Thermoplasmata archaeon]|nr:triose-phosphate isomerase [Thermoplasmata archaeon]TFG69682.1 MAG: triose-phosphate isomerase [Methanomassiliicoccus sp.]
MSSRRLIIAVNFKTYVEASGDEAVSLAKICDDVARETGASIVVAPPMPDISRIASIVDIPVFAQHVDDVKPGGTTGYVTLENVKASGARGTLLNHSEHRIKVAEIHDLIERAHQLSLSTIVCTNNTGVSRACAAMGPDYVAIEPPELIGGDISVTTANPKIVSDTVTTIRSVSDKVSVLCGAGVKNGVDVRKAIELGAEGVLLASGVVKAKDKMAVLLDLVSGLDG